jgi:thiol-disulfide isomerase/thioredoxin
MRRIIIPVIILLIVVLGCKASKQVKGDTAIAKEPADQQSVTDSHITDFNNPTSWLLGYFKPERLYQVPYSEWFIKGYDEYKFDPDIVNTLKTTISQDITIKIVMGTWCPDSRREVPRFMRILNAIDFPVDRVQFIGVDNAKKSPVENYESLDIIRVPTFIIYKNNIEKGRIIENPTTSLEQDMVNILTRNEK